MNRACLLILSLLAYMLPAAGRGQDLSLWSGYKKGHLMPGISVGIDAKIDKITTNGFWSYSWHEIAWENQRGKSSVHAIDESNLIFIRCDDYRDKAIGERWTGEIAADCLVTNENNEPIRCYIAGKGALARPVAKAVDEAITGKLLNVSVRIGPKPPNAIYTGQPLAVLFSGQYSLSSTNARLERPSYSYRLLIEKPDGVRDHWSGGGGRSSGLLDAKKVSKGRWDNEQLVGIPRDYRLLFWKIELSYWDPVSKALVLDVATNATEEKCKKLGEKIDYWLANQRP